MYESTRSHFSNPLQEFTEQSNPFLMLHYNMLWVSLQIYYTETCEQEVLEDDRFGAEEFIWKFALKKHLSLSLTLWL